MHRTYRCHQNAYCACTATYRAMAAAYGTIQIDGSGSVFYHRSMCRQWPGTISGKLTYPKGYPPMSSTYRCIISTPPGGYPPPPPPRGGGLPPPRFPRKNT